MPTPRPASTYSRSSSRSSLGTWTEPSFSFSGAHYTLKDLDAQPRPVQSPRPPLIMGGSAGPRSAMLAARYADEYNTPFATLQDVAYAQGDGDRSV